MRYDRGGRHYARAHRRRRHRRADSALALRQAGLDVHVYEQAAVLREVGAGLLLGPNAVKVLHHLGLEEALGPVVVVPRSLDSRDWQDGSVLTRVPLADAAVARWGAPAYNVHRADLHDALAPPSGTVTSRSARGVSPSSRTDPRLRSDSPTDAPRPATC